MKKNYLLLLTFTLIGCNANNYKKLINISTSADPKNSLKILTEQKAEAYLKNPNLLKQDLQKIEDIGKAFANLKKSVDKIWGEQDAKEPSAKEYVKYINDYKSRAIIDYEKGIINIGTVDQQHTEQSLKEAIVMTLLMPQDPSGEDLFNTNKIKLGGEPYLYNEVVDNEGESIRWEWRANKYADYLIKNALKTYQLANHKTAYYVQIPMVKKHDDIRANKYQNIVSMYAKQYNVDEKLIYAIIKTESDFNQYAISKSGAIGLMQIMPNTAGADAYQAIYNKEGKPTQEYLFDAQNNIQMGVVYIDILKNRYLKNINNKTSHEYCVISAYNGGSGTVLKAFHSDRNKAFDEINKKTSNQVYSVLTTKVASQETREYLIKVNNNKKLF